MPHDQPVKRSARRTLAIRAFLSLALLAPFAQAAGIFDGDDLPQAPAPIKPPAPRQGTAEKPAAAEHRQPVPPHADRVKAQQAFKKTFAADLADASIPARRDFAARLLTEADLKPDGSAEQFVLLLASAQASAEGADFATCQSTLNRMTEGYDVDAARLEAIVAAKAVVTTDNPVDTEDSCRQALEFVDQLTLDGEFATADRLLALVRTAAGSDPTFARKVQNRTNAIAAIRSAAPRVAPQIEKLKANPQDPAANTAVGHFDCLVKGDWPRGLPLLASGSDAALKSLATQDLAAPTGGDERAALADAWWDYAAQSNGVPKARALARAATWYTAAVPTLAAERKARVQRRLSEIDAQLHGTPQFTDLLDAMEQGGSVRRQPGATLLEPSGRLTTPTSYRPPMTFRMAVMTDERDFRLAYAADQIILNWEGNRDELRVDGGPAAGRHKMGAGRIPANRWVVVTLTVTPREMILATDGKERYRVSADFSKVNAPLSLTAYNGDVRVKWVRIPIPAGGSR